MPKIKGLQSGVPREVSVLDPDDSCDTCEEVFHACLCETPKLPNSDTNGNQHFVGTVKGHSLGDAF